MRSSFNWKNIKVFLHLLKNWGRLSSSKKWGYLSLVNDWGCLPFAKKLRSSSICQKNEVVFHLPKNWCRLPFARKLRSSSICQPLSSSSELGPTTFLYGSLSKFCSVQAISLLFRVGGWAGGRPGGRMLDISKIRLISAFKLSLTWSLGWAWQKYSIKIWWENKLGLIFNNLFD